METKEGSPSPKGIKITDEGVNFSIFSKNATSVDLLLFLQGEKVAIPMHRTGDMWHVFVSKLSLPINYAYSLDGPYEIQNGHRFNKKHTAIDPYSKSHAMVEKEAKSERIPQLGIYQKENLIIYEMHVRGFTKSATSKLDNAGSFKAMIEKIPYLKDLGVTSVELLPVFAFDPDENSRKNPDTGERLKNYWGYNTLNFFSLAKWYGTSNDFKELIRALHNEKIEVILDVVYNHSHAFQYIDNQVYYHINEHGDYMNYSGCGNTINCNNPVVLELILDSLCYFVEEMGVDGFRFDLASILTRGEDGAPMQNPTVLQKIKEHPSLKNTKWIAESWDAAGLYQLGQFPKWGKFSEWNGFFRDSVRSFMKGDEGMATFFQKALLGSPHIYECATDSINFVTAHDGFSLLDLVSYNQKHNDANGENNKDGSDNNISWNCGEEGETENLEVLALREQMQRNFLVILFVSKGIPMLLMGDEYGHSKKGNNNTWCQDNDLSYFNWEMQEKSSLYEFTKFMIQFRKTTPCFQSNQTAFVWHGVTPNNPDLSNTSHFIAFSIDNYYVAINAYHESLSVKLPAGNWEKIIDTQFATIEFTPFGSDYIIKGRTCLIAKKNP